MDNLLLIIVGAAVIIAVAYAVFNYLCVRKMEEGTERMGEIAGAVFRAYRNISHIIPIVKKKMRDLQGFSNGVWKIPPKREA